MKRTTIVLPDDLAALLDWERRRRGVSAAAIVREALDAHLARPTGPLPFVALGRSGYHDTAERIEEILEQEWTPDLLRGSGLAPKEAASAATTECSQQPFAALAQQDATARADGDVSVGSTASGGGGRMPHGNGRDRPGGHRDGTESAREAIVAGPRRANVDLDGGAG